MTTTHVRTPSGTVPIEPFRDPEFVVIDRGGYPLVLHREDLHAATGAVVGSGGRITSVEELDALPDGTRVRDRDGDVWERWGGEWHTRETRPFDSGWLLRKWAPLTVLPDTPAPVSAEECRECAHAATQHEGGNGPCGADGCECAERDALVSIPVEAATALLRVTESMPPLRDAYVSRCLRAALVEVRRDG